MSETGTLADETLKLEPEEREHLAALRRAFTTGAAPVVFVGAGMSAFNAVRARHPSAGRSGRTGPATWEQVTVAMRDALQDQGMQSATVPSVRALPTFDLPSDPTELAEIFEQKIGGRSELERFVLDQVADSEFEPGDAHFALASLPWAAVITTNYDTLLERAFHALSVPLHRIVSVADLPNTGPKRALELVKMHGCVSQPSTIVLGRREYERFEHDRGAVDAKLKQLLLQHPVLYLGFGVRDPNHSRILRWLETNGAKAAVRSVAVIHKPRAPSEHAMLLARGIAFVLCRDDVTLSSLLKGIEPAHQDPATDTQPARESDELERLIVEWQQCGRTGDVRPLAEALLSAARVAESERAHQSIRQRLGATGSLSGVWSQLVDSLSRVELVDLMKNLARASTSLFIPGIPQQVGAMIHVDLAAGLLAFGDLVGEEQLRLIDAWTQAGGRRHRGVLDAPSAAAALKRMETLLAAGTELSHAHVELCFELAYRSLSPAWLNKVLDWSHQLEFNVATKVRRARALAWLGKTDDALALARSARARARTGDERYLALAACFDIGNALHGVGAWDELESYHRELRSIPADQRPDAAALDAGIELESVGHGGLKATERALDDLNLARRRRRHGLGFGTETTRAVTLLLEQAEINTDGRWARFSNEPNALRLAIEAMVELGVDLASVLSWPRVERWSRHWPEHAAVVHRVRALGELAPRAAQARSSLLLIFADVVDDAALDAEVESIGAHGWSEPERRALKALVEGAERLPTTSQVTVIRALAAQRWNRSLSWRELARCVIQFHVQRTDETVRAALGELDTHLEVVLSEFEPTTRYFDEDLLIRLVLKLDGLGRLSASTRDAFERALRARLDLPKWTRDQAHDLCRLIDLDRLRPSPEIAERFLGMFPGELGTHDLQTWLAAAPYVLHTQGEAARGFDSLRSYVAPSGRTLPEKLELLLHDLDAQALIGTMASLLRKSGRASEVESVALLRDLAGEHPDALAEFADLLDDKSAAALRVHIEASLWSATEADSKRAAVRALFRWLELRPSDWDALGPLAAHAPLVDTSEGRIQSLWESSRLARDVPKRWRDECIERTFLFTERAHPWLIRANATGALLEVTNDTVHEERARAHLEALTHDEVTLVRRVAEEGLARGKRGVA